MAESKTTDTIARQLFLRTMNPTRTIGQSSASRLVEVMQDVVLQAGSVIYRQGQAPELIYFIVDGMVALRAEGSEDWTFGDRSVIGVIDANLDRPRARTAVALTDVHLLVVRADDYFEILEDNFEQQRSVVYTVTSTLRPLLAAAGPGGGFPQPPPEVLIPRELRPLTPVEVVLLLRSTGAFQRASIRAITTLSEHTTVLRVSAGPLPLKPGGKNGALLFVARGAIELTRPAPPLGATFWDGGLIGGISSLAEPSDETQLTALVPSYLLRLEEEALFDVMEDHFDLVRSVIAHTSLERERLLAARVSVEHRARAG